MLPAHYNSVNLAARLTGLATMVVLLINMYTGLELSAEVVAALVLAAAGLVIKDYDVTGLKNANWRTTTVAFAGSALLLLNQLFNWELPYEIIMSVVVFALALLTKDYTIDGRLGLGANWRTTVSGLIGSVFMFLNYYFGWKFPTELATGIALNFMLLFAKDADATNQESIILR